MMIEPTEADIGRRVVYDVKKELGYVARGVLVGLTGGPFKSWIQVQFDGGDAPLNVGSNLVWADEFKARAKSACSALTSQDKQTP